MSCHLASGLLTYPLRVRKRPARRTNPVRFDKWTGAIPSVGYIPLVPPSSQEKPMRSKFVLDWRPNAP
jgi:hypothetical protein